MTTRKPADWVNVGDVLLLHGPSDTGDYELDYWTVVDIQVGDRFTEAQGLHFQLRNPAGETRVHFFYGDQHVNVVSS